jgi:hypothetical protein
MSSEDSPGSDAARESERRSRRPRRLDADDGYDDEDREDRRRREKGDATGGVIPYKNPTALTAYYCGVFGLISCFLLLGVFGIVPIILGVLGLRHARRHPESRGQAHAIVGIVLGSVELLTFLAQLGLIITSMAR